MSKTRFVCQSCSAAYPKWQGQCTSCGEWNTLVEEVVESPSKARAHRTHKSAVELQQVVTPLKDVGELTHAHQRLSTGIAELDRVLGGTESQRGLVPGAVMLIGGEPGIGKSTLLTQVVLHQLALTHDAPLLYISGEESPSQIGIRIKRLLENDPKKYSTKNTTVQELLSSDKLKFVTTTNVDEVIEVIRTHQPKLVIVDSIQTLITDELTGAPGSVGQIREATDRLTVVVKQLHIPTFLVGHVTKEGTIAGPKVLEHIVDAVLELSGERTGELRILRAIKNRFGATDEVGVFKVNEVGLAEVTNPSEFLLEHTETMVPGSATTCVVEGTRPLLLEVQALVVGSQLAMPRRVGRGIDVSRIQVLAAVLQKHCGLPIGTQDVFLSAAGGYKVQETGMDLGLVVALASSLKNKPLPAKTVFIGEVGLLGEVRKVNYLDRRIKEAKRLGFTTVYSRENVTHVRELLKKLGLMSSRISSESMSSPEP